MVFSMPVMNELPNVRFEKNENKKASGVIFNDDSEDFVKKDQHLVRDERDGNTSATIVNTSLFGLHFSELNPKWAN